MCWASWAVPVAFVKREAIIQIEVAIKIVSLRLSFALSYETAAKTFDHWANVSVIFQPFFVAPNRGATYIENELDTIEAEHE